MNFLIKSFLVGTIAWQVFTPVPAFSHDTSQALGKYFFFKTCEIAKKDMQDHLEFLDDFLKKYDEQVKTSTTTEMLLRVARIQDRVAYLHSVFLVTIDAIVDTQFLDFILVSKFLEQKLYSPFDSAEDLRREVGVFLKTFENAVDMDDSYKFNKTLLLEARKKMSDCIKALENILAFQR